MIDSHRFKPAVSRRATVFVAAAVWGFAAWKVLTVGAPMFMQEPVGLHLVAGLAGFPVFFLLVFRKVTRRHTRRLVTARSDRPCVFSFFDRRGYMVMAFMITLGLTVRHLALLPADFLGPFYLSLGLSLGLSALLFLRGGLRYETLRREWVE